MSNDDITHAQPGKEVIDDVIRLEKVWYTLKEACFYKGLNTKTAYNKPYLQPNYGIEDARIGGRKKWKRDTIKDWLFLTDEDIAAKECEVCN